MRVAANNNNNDGLVGVVVSFAWITEVRKPIGGRQHYILEGVVLPPATQRARHQAQGSLSRILPWRPLSFHIVPSITRTAATLCLFCLESQNTTPNQPRYNRNIFTNWFLFCYCSQLQPFCVTCRHMQLTVHTDREGIAFTPQTLELSIAPRHHVDLDVTLCRVDWRPLWPKDNLFWEAQHQLAFFFIFDTLVD